MRIPGLGGEIFRCADGTPVNLPSAKLFTSLKSSVIDATEWAGPYNDLTFDFHKAAKRIYEWYDKIWKQVTKRDEISDNDRVRHKNLKHRQNVLMHVLCRPVNLAAVKQPMDGLSSL